MNPYTSPYFDARMAFHLAAGIRRQGRHATIGTLLHPLTLAIWRCL